MKRASLRQFKRAGTLLLNFTFIYSLGSTVVLACSGNRTLELIEHNRSVVRLYMLISGACLLASVVLFFLRQRKGLWVVVLTIFLMVHHPVWIYGGGGGDCGRSMAGGAMFLSVLAAIGVAYQLRAWLIARDDAIRVDRKHGLNRT
jgi:hypothetical protein